MDQHGKKAEPRVIITWDSGIRRMLIDEAHFSISMGRCFFIESKSDKFLCLYTHLIAEYKRVSPS